MKEFGIGDVIRKARKGKGWSQERLGLEAAKFVIHKSSSGPINKSTVSKIENDPYSSEIGHMLRLSAALGIGLEDIGARSSVPFMTDAEMRAAGVLLREGERLRAHARAGKEPDKYLNDDQRAAWQLFIEADAWGRYSTGAFARTIRSAGWPAGVRPYQARHTTWITASELGIDLEDISIGAGHTDPRMTRRVYVPVLNSRLQRLGEALDGRFQGWPVVPTSDPDGKA